MKKLVQAVILKNECYVDHIFDMLLSAREIAELANPGQFINLYTGKGEMLLPRPISLCEINRKEGTLRLLYQAVGKGTQYFTTLQKNDTIKVMGPLGNGFFIDKKCQKHILIGGGIGVPPLLELAKTLQGTVSVLIGAKSNPILVKEFEKIGAAVFVATDDGSYGIHGTVLDILKKEALQADMIYACGPKAMLKATSDWAEQNKMSIQVSMEERMACGIGACVGCTVKIKKDSKKDWENRKVCKDGPVFWGNEVAWNAQ